MSKAPTNIPWRIIAAEIIAATKADPDSLRSIYDDREFRPGRNASVWAQLSARLAQQRKVYREAVAKGSLKEVRHNMLRRCFAHDYTKPGAYMVTLVVPQRGSNPFGTIKGDIRQNRTGITIAPEAIASYASFDSGGGPLRLELTPLGAAILTALRGITANYPMIHVRKAQIMPDHLHLILVVTAPIVSSKGTPRHLGHVIAGFKKGCNHVYWQHIYSAGEPQSTGRPPLWAEGYTDTIILTRTHMATEEAYLDDNIYRLRMKQLHRNLLRRVLHIRLNGQHFAALGNIHLLRKPWKLQVQFHHWEQDVPAGYLPCDSNWHCQRFYYSAAKLQNTATNLQNTATNAQNTATNAQNTAVNAQSITPQRAQAAMIVSSSSAAGIYTLGTPIQGPTEAEAHTERLMKAGDEGAVFVSPFISETEKALRDAALTMGIPYIRLTREGFRDLYTPTKSEFEACCEGNLLILAPWEDRRRTTTITRKECMELNKVAQVIAGDDLALTLVGLNENGEGTPNLKGNENEDKIIPRDDE